MGLITYIFTTLEFPIKYVRFADDQAMVPDSEKGLQEIMDKLVEVGRKYDMEINVKKTKTRMSRRDRSVINIVIEGKNVEQMKQIQVFRSYDNRR